MAASIGRKLIPGLTQAGKTLYLQKRGIYPYHIKYLVTPPRTPMHVAERWFWFGLLVFSTTSVPMWVLYHLREYRGQTYDDWIAYQNKWARSS